VIRRDSGSFGGSWVVVAMGCFLTAAGAWLGSSASPAVALPLYASREGAKCASCHFDPNGGGMRNDFGFDYDKNRHSMEQESRWDSVQITPQVNNWIRLGLDTRVLYVADHINGISGFKDSFFPMQGNFRFAITPHEHLAVLGSYGIVIQEPGFPEPYMARELYAKIQNLPDGGFAKVGRFRVPFGLRQDDHTSFTRIPEFLGYDSQKEDAGISVGSVGKHGWFELALTNGGEPFDQNVDAVSGKIAWAWMPLQGGFSAYHLGASDAFSGTHSDRLSLYLTKTYKRWTAMGEYAGGTNHNFGRETNKRAGFGELVYRASRGVNVRGKYDYFDSHDPFLGIWRRYSGEVDVAPMPFTEFQFAYRRYDYAKTADVDELLAQLFVPF